MTRSAGVEEGAAIERDAKYEFMARNTLRDEPLDGLRGTDGTPKNIRLMVGYLVPGTSYVGFSHRKKGSEAMKN
jgi:hypothetical protein